MIPLEQAREHSVWRLVADALPYRPQYDLHCERIVDGALGRAARHVLFLDLVVKASQAVERRGAEELGRGPNDDAVITEKRLDFLR